MIKEPDTGSKKGNCSAKTWAEIIFSQLVWIMFYISDPDENF